ncbi:hypothetical protein F5887DRAFT_877262 [Amanita rubescens]|nr:hypothetical protein F5887DRAFT_877262 [Amanita rubescens]
MQDTPYTTADEDPFHVTPRFNPPRRRRSSLLDKWIRDQQILPSPASAVESYLDVHDFSPSSKDDDPSVHSYDLVQDQDIPHSTDIVNILSDLIPQPHPPLQDFDTMTPSRASRLLHRATSFRNFNLHFRSNSSAQPASTVNESPRSSSRPSSRLSFLTKNPLQARNSTSSGDTSQSHHNRSPSLSTVQGPGSCASPRTSIATISSRWRPSVLSHFSTPSMSSHVSTSTPKNEPPYTPPRPSVSSADTFLTGASDNEIGHFFSKLSLVETFRSRGDPSKSRIASSSSIWSQSQTTPTSVPSPCDSPRSISQSPCSLQRPRNSLRPYAPAFDEELDEVEEESEQPSPPSPEPSTRPQIAYSSVRHRSRMRLPSMARRHKKKRRLVVSGIKPNDVRKFDSLKRWCENFGEVNQITRMPNNDLHVHFRRADVAETVCRLRAKVHINGVGSVQLSWSYGDKH